MVYSFLYEISNHIFLASSLIMITNDLDISIDNIFIKTVDNNNFCFISRSLVFLHHNNIFVFSLYPLSEYSSQFLLMNSNEILLDVFLAARGYVLLRIQHISTISTKCIIIFSFENNFGKNNNTVYKSMQCDLRSFDVFLTISEYYLK